MKSPITLLCFLASAMMGVAPAAADDWPQSGRDPAGAAASSEIFGATFSKGWTLSLGTAPILTTPVVADGTLVVGDTAGKLQAIRALTGAVRWTAAAGAGFAASPIVSNGRVFATSLDGSLTAFRAVDGTTVWRQILGGQTHGSPIWWNGTIVLATGFPINRIVRVAASDGQIQWATVTRSFTDLVNGTPVVWNDELIEGSRGGRFDRVALGTGDVTGHLDAGGSTQAIRPVVLDGHVFMLTGGGAPRLATLDLATGAAQTGISIADPTPPPADARTPYRSAVSSPVAIGDRIAFQVRFEYDLPGSLPAQTTYLLREWLLGFNPTTGVVSPLAALGSVEVGNPNAIPELGICPTPAVFGSVTGPLVASASSIEPMVRVVDPIRAAVLWSSELAGPSRAPITVANAQLFVATDAGVLHAFHNEANFPPTAPVGLSPARGRPINPAWPVVSWWAAMDPEGHPASYTVRIDEDGEVMETWQEEITTGAGVTAATFTKPLQEGHVYSFAVRARDASGAWSEWSAVETFRVESTPDIAVAGKKFGTIDDAIAAAHAGDTIALGAGTLHLSLPLVLPAGVNLEGASARVTHIDATGLDAGIRTAPGTASAITIRGVEVSGAGHGIEIAGTRGITVQNVVLCDNRESGLHVTGDVEATLVNATVVRNGIGVLALGSARVRNSIVTENKTGLSVVGTGQLVSSYNDLFANSVASYDHVERGLGDLASPVTFPDSPGRNFLLAAAQASTDRGDPHDAFSAEPAPNGNRINLGAFGNTADAEPSASVPSGGCDIGGGDEKRMPWWTVVLLALPALRHRRRKL